MPPSEPSVVPVHLPTPSPWLPWVEKCAIGLFAAGAVWAGSRGEVEALRQRQVATEAEVARMREERLTTATRFERIEGDIRSIREGLDSMKDVLKDIRQFLRPETTPAARR